MFILCFALLHLLNIPASSIQELEIPENVPDEQFYKELERRSSNYGTCWKTTLDKLNRSCNDFSEEAHSHLALSFSNCFLINAGMEACLCKEHVKIADCLKNCPDRVFNVFTEFYTHTKSVCHFLQQKNFQVESFKLQLMLKRSSTHVKELLEKSVEDQSTSLNLQKEVLKEQQKSIDNGKS